MGELKPWHIIIVVALFFILFGYKKLPDATRSLGRSLRILKTEVKSLHEDEAETPAAAEAETKPAAAPRAVEAPRASLPDAPSPGASSSSPVAAGAPVAPAPDDHR